MPPKRNIRKWMLKLRKLRGGIYITRPPPFNPGPAGYGERRKQWLKEINGGRKVKK